MVWRTPVGIFIFPEETFFYQMINVTLQLLTLFDVMSCPFSRWAGVLRLILPCAFRHGPRPTNIFFLLEFNQDVFRGGSIRGFLNASLGPDPHPFTLLVSSLKLSLFYSFSCLRLDLLSSDSCKITRKPTLILIVYDFRKGHDPNCVSQV